jgi:hypothetical protein
MNKFKTTIFGVALTLGALGTITAINAENILSPNIEFLQQTFGTENITRSTRDHRHGIYTLNFESWRTPSKSSFGELRDFELVGFNFVGDGTSIYLKYTPLNFSVNFSTNTADEIIRLRTLLNRGDITVKQYEFLLDELNNYERVLPPSHMITEVNEAVIENEEDK